MSKMQSTIQNRTIFCKDNLEVLKGMDSESVDLIYLDPPFNKKKTFTAPLTSTAKGASFKDIFQEEDVKSEWVETIREDNVSLYELLDFARKAEGRASYNFCYLSYMAIRLIEIHRLLKNTGSVYLHCDPTMSHYLKLSMDCIFGEKNFRNEIVWAYRKMPNNIQAWQRNHDIILFYTKTSHFYFEKIEGEATEGSKKTHFSGMKRGYNANNSKKMVTVFDWAKYNKAVADGKMPADLHVQEFTGGNPPEKDWWNDIKILGGPKNKEKIGYPTQKPLRLLERIIQASSPIGGVVLDPFCGCATTCIAAEKLKRKWIGIDISQKAYELVKSRLGYEVEMDDTMFHEQLVNFKTDPPTRTDGWVSAQEMKWIYVISHPNYSGEYKVGIAKDWQARLNSYQTSDPDRAFAIEYKKLVPKFREVERHVHEKFPNKYEWVRADLADIVKAIDEYLTFE